MAELLIKANEGYKDDPMVFQKGDIVEVREDNAKYGRLECLPNFLVIKIDGKKEDLIYLMESITHDVRDDKGIIDKEVDLIRKHNFDIDSHVSKEQLEEIKNSDWKINTYNLSSLTEKYV